MGRNQMKRKFSVVGFEFREEIVLEDVAERTELMSIARESAGHCSTRRLREWTTFRGRIHGILPKRTRFARVMRKRCRR
jgi:hypothetical protein